jgi:hypothetical protein
MSTPNSTVTRGVGGTGKSTSDPFDTRVSSLRSRTQAIGLGGWLATIGGILIPLGLILVFLGWLGASRTPLVQEQIPYLISGGLLGVSLVFLGAFLYFAYWLAQLVQDNHTGQQQIIERLERAEGHLARLSEIAAPAGTQFVATATGTMIHRADCPAVAGRAGLRTVGDGERGMTPCSICQPLAVG